MSVKCLVYKTTDSEEEIVSATPAQIQNSFLLQKVDLHLSMKQL